MLMRPEHLRGRVRRLTPMLVSEQSPRLTAGRARMSRMTQDVAVSQALSGVTVLHGSKSDPRQHQAQQRTRRHLGCR